VGGDFYDAFVLAEEQKIGLVIGDVCDKGVGAALFMTLFRSLIRATADYMMTGLPLPATDPEVNEPDNRNAAALRDTVMLTNNYVVRTHNQTSVFTTLFFGLLDPITGDLLYVNGGQEPPLILGLAGVRTRLEPTGPVVGIWPEADFQVHQIRLEPGETLLAFTDGVPDALSPARERFTQQRLLALVESPAASAADLLDRIQAGLDDFIADANKFDDITLLAVRRTVS
jgi:serine phosphatase RsbU (regulator of sigma subunit)